MLALQPANVAIADWVCVQNKCLVWNTWKEMIGSMFRKSVSCKNCNNVFLAHVNKKVLVSSSGNIGLVSI